MPSIFTDGQFFIGGRQSLKPTGNMNLAWACTGIRDVRAMFDIALEVVQGNLTQFYTGRGQFAWLIPLNRFQIRS